MRKDKINLYIFPVIELVSLEVSKLIGQAEFFWRIEMYNKLVLMLDELKRMDCLTQEECNVMNEHLQNKLENRN